MTQADLILTTAQERHKGAKANQRDGASLKKAGQQQVLEKQAAEWKEKALYLLGIFVKAKEPGELFAFEDARAYMAACGLADPHDHHVWGAMPAQALAAGIPMEMTDRTRPAHSPRTHAHRVHLWRRTP